jgi:ribonuclease D
MNEPPNADSFLYVDTAEGLQGLVQRLEQAPEIALDTEADSLHHYFEKVCLIQLSAEEEHVIVDPLSGIDLSALLGVLGRKPLVLHGADYDLRMLRMSFGFQPAGEVFDTMLASRLLGHQELGLASLVERVSGVRLSKGGQKSDWSRRPLSRAQLRYASDDTRYLLSVSARLRAELERLGRIPWLRETCLVMIRHALLDRVRDPDEVWRIKGSGRLSRRELHFLRAAFFWRDGEARQVDLPTFRILANAQLLDLAVRSAREQEDALGSVSAWLPRSGKDKRLLSLGAALREAAGQPESRWPAFGMREEKPERLPNALLSALREEGNRVARETGIEPTTLVTRSAMENLVRKQPGTLEEIMECGPLMRWQAVLLEPGVRKILKGR